MQRQVGARDPERPDRYGGFAHLALQDPGAAADELARRLSRRPRYDVFWERASDLRAPIYIHPGNPPDHSHMYEGRPEMWGPTWSWAVETCSHAMRLIFSGLFDRYPDVRVILGHMGETLPIQIWRLDSRLPASHPVSAGRSIFPIGNPDHKPPAATTARRGPGRSTWPTGRRNQPARPPTARLGRQRRSSVYHGRTRT